MSDEDDNELKRALAGDDGPASPEREEEDRARFLNALSDVPLCERDIASLIKALADFPERAGQKEGVRTRKPK
jgi:hypothetical protein